MKYIKTFEYEWKTEEEQLLIDAIFNLAKQLYNYNFSSKQSDEDKNRIYVFCEAKIRVKWVWIKFDSNFSFIDINFADGPEESPLKNIKILTNFLISILSKYKRDSSLSSINKKDIEKIIPEITLENYELFNAVKKYNL